MATRGELDERIKSQLLRCSSLTIGLVYLIKDPECCLLRIVPIGQEMRELLLLNDIIEMNQSGSKGKTFLLR